MAINSMQGITQAQTAKVGGVEQDKRPEAQPPVKSLIYKEAPSLEARNKAAALQQERVQEAARQLNNFMKIVSVGLHFTVDADTKQTVVKVINKETGEVIRQIPSEEALRLSKAMDTLQGLIIQQTV